MSQIQLPSSKWYDHFVETLETRGATPQQVSDAVATVHSHCLEANRPPELAFGDPREYALQVGPQRPRLPREWTHLAMNSFIAVLWLAPTGIKHLVNGGPGVSWYFTGLALLILLPPVVSRAMLARGVNRWAVSAVAVPPMLVAFYALYRWGWNSPTPVWVWLPVLAVAAVLLPVALYQSWRGRITDPVSGREFALASNSMRSMVFWMVVLLTGYFAVMLASIYLF